MISLYVSIKNIYFPYFIDMKCFMRETCYPLVNTGVHGVDNLGLKMYPSSEKAFILSLFMILFLMINEAIAPPALLAKTLTIL